jgi:hypothetical protein
MSFGSQGDHVLTTTQTAAAFDDHLRSAGFRKLQPDALAAWQAFKAFAAVPVACVDDQLLFQCGVYHFTGPELFELDSTRRFKPTSGSAGRGVSRTGLGPAA